MHVIIIFILFSLYIVLYYIYAKYLINVIFQNITQVEKKYK
jgi:hypothetical protein